MSKLPFRWNIARREQLGRLLDAKEVTGIRYEYDLEFIDDLRRCCVRLLAQCGDGDLLFIGRSPESIFDYLSGLLSETSFSNRCTLLNVSMKGESIRIIEGTNPSAVRAFESQLSTNGLDPKNIASSDRPLVIVDLVYKGRTFGNLAELIILWAKRTKVDLKAVRRRLRFLGITERTKNSPNTWRWYQKVPWANEFPRSSLQSVSISIHLWRYLGNWQSKVTRSYPPDEWGDERHLEPPRDMMSIRALQLAARIYDLGCQTTERERFASDLAAQPEMKKPWLRSLVTEIRTGNRNDA